MAMSAGEVYIKKSDGSEWAIVVADNKMIILDNGHTQEYPSAKDFKANYVKK